ncbi:MAG: DUF1553 domain-containing protein [Planctomycetaceae bacterium]|nr:DUF1553 domain-containing protein [Planctomycetaceae bacterium]MCB9951171.1 DUF1553 domain-containing protein [Planctomycetaceae bacterium]
MFAHSRPFVLAFALALLPFQSVLQAAEPLEYNRDVRPILADTCFKCHGPDSAARKAELRLDQREAAVESGAIAPGNSGDSGIIARIFTNDPDELMPPPDSHKELTDAQKQILKRWVDEGAEYQPHWSFIAPQRPEVPTVSNPQWVVNPIDAFVLARLDAEGLKPADPADRRIIARRVSLDLTGLPPSVELLNQFLNDSSPNAYERYVDALLKSHKWGEHRGRYWLDYARYADTHGIHFDNYREMWTYRDWVIQSFNANMPYDQFTTENLAGDLLPNRTLEQWIGSGFNRCNMTTNEGGIIDEEYKVLYARDRTETTAQVWLGITANCCTCHDHKFDPMTQRDFYQMSAFFNNTTQGVRDGNIKNTPPVVPVVEPEDRPRYAELETLIPQQRQHVAARKMNARPEFDTWLANATPSIITDALPTEGLDLHAPLNEGEGQVTKIVRSGEAVELGLAESTEWDGAAPDSGLKTQGTAFELADYGGFEANQPVSFATWIKVSPNDTQGAILSRMDVDKDYRGWDIWMQRRQIGTHIISAWADNALKVVAKAQVPADEWVHVAITYDGSSKAAGVRVYYNGVPQETNVERDQLNGSIVADVPFKVGQRSTGQPFGGSLRELRIYTRQLNDGEVTALGQLSVLASLLAKTPEERTPEEVDKLYQFWLVTYDTQHQELTARLASLEQEEQSILNRGSIAHVMVEKTEAPMAFVLFRGDYDKRRDEVGADTPAFLPAFPNDIPRNRLGLAQWLLRPENPLTARVTVNRFWQEVFGTGIVKTTGDFGVSGELPVNPELLDWLAVDFRESGWDVKRLFKLIVMSNTYRQAATTTPEKHERDPENRLLSHGPRFRMDAEMVRDSALFTSGLLVDRIGGPSVKPYQPEGVWEAIAMNVSNTRSYQPDAGEGLYRRSMYWFWKRMAPPASMDIFNAPNREFCVVRRERTNTPLQALVTLNDVQFVEAARVLAQQVLMGAAQDDAARINEIAIRIISRPLSDAEQAIVGSSLQELRNWYGSHPEEAAKLLAYGETPVDENLDAAELAAWTMLVNELMNLDEVLCK